MEIGLISGLLAAFLMALAFAFSSYAVRNFKKAGSLGILLRANIIIALISAFGLLLTYKTALGTQWRVYLPVTLGGALCNLVGQAAIFLAQKRVDSSRLVPLLGLKLIFLAIINGLLLQSEVYGTWQYIAIACTIFSAFFLNNAGTKIPIVPFLLMMITCISYSVADTFLRTQTLQIKALGYNNICLAAVVGTFVFFLFLGLISAILLPFLPRDTWAAWKGAIPFSLCWLTSIVLILICFAELGTVAGNIVQSLRGIFAILIGGLLAMLGYHKMEQKITAVIFYKRLFAGFLMVIAIYLFTLGK